MYFVTLAGRNYNIAISPRAGAPGQQSAAFTSRLETCNGPIQPVNCNITIDFDWDAGGAGSGTGQVTIFSGSSSASTIPAPGNALNYVGITNISDGGFCTSYNSIIACPPYSNTTTTTTTSTTTTTTTIIPASYSDPVIKHDEYSSSYNPGTTKWLNLGSGLSAYDLYSYSGNINSGGSGTGVYLGITSSFISEEEVGLAPVFNGSFLNLNNKSFSYAVVFRVETPLLGYTVTSVRSTFDTVTSKPCGFGISGGSFSNGTPYIQPYMYKPGSDIYGPKITISANPKWYLGVLTFDKTLDSSNCAKFYLNLSSVTSFSGLSAIPSPSTFFINSTYEYSLGLTLNPIKLAAAIFWNEIILSQAQIQTLYNEYNSRYSLG